jgi:hypothetical protein
MPPAVPVVVGPRPLHPRHGIHAPRRSVPPHRPGSIRRTSTIDTVRPGDILGDAVQFGRARDLRTAPDGSTTVLAEATLRTRLASTEGGRLLEIASDPADAGLDSLLGRSVSTGFRAAMIEAVPAQEAGATLLHLLLDDLPGAALVSAYAIGAAGGYPERPPDPARAALQIAGLCAGFQHGGTIIDEIDAGRTPPVVTGPPAPSIVPDDPLAWHELRAMGAHDMRRWRMLDVVSGPTAESPVEVEAYFRDSHVAPGGTETVIHEYTVSVLVDPSTAHVVASAAEAHTLPWVECIEAEGSGSRLVGRPLRGLRPDVRQEFTGITTCTHLNDTMRSMEDVRALLAMLDP